MDLVESVVAIQLLHVVLARVPVSAEDLDGVGDAVLTRRGGPGLRDRREHLEQQRGAIPVGGIGRRVLFIDQARAGEHERERAFGGALLLQEQAAHIGVLDDRDRRRLGVLLAGQATLPPRACVVERVAECRIAHRGGGPAHADARLVHHVEHVREAVVGLADEVADAWTALAEVEERRGRAAPAHLVDEAGRRDVVGAADRPVRTGLLLGHDEQRDALGALGRALDAGEHEVDDVRRELVITSGDPDLGPLDMVGAIGGGRRASTEVRERRARVGLGECHGARPAAGEHRREPERFLRFAAERRDEVRRAGREHWVTRRADVGGLEERDGRAGDHVGQLHAAARLVVRARDQPRLGHRVPALLEARRGDDHTVHQLGLMLVVVLPERGVVLIGHAARRVEHGVVDLTTLSGEARATGERVHVEQFVEQEVEVARFDPEGHGVLNGVRGAAGDVAAPDRGPIRARTRCSRSRRGAPRRGVPRPGSSCAPADARRTSAGRRHSSARTPSCRAGRRRSG